MNRFIAATHATQSAGRLHRQAGLRGLLALALALSAALMPGYSVAAPLVTLWYVSPGGDDANDCLSSLSACAHIQSAIGKTSAGDTIIIGPGTYAENLSIAESITLQGADQTTTIIDGQALGSTILINNATVNLSGVTVRNGQNSYGAGINIGSSAVVNISNSRISQNTGSGGGAGIANQGSLKLINVSLSDNINNGNDNGGGLRNLGSAELINSVVNNNQSASNAGGIYNRGVLTLTNSALSGNQAAGGGAIYNQNMLTLNNTLISRNQATGAAGGGIYNAGLGFNLGSVIDAGSLITGNVAATSGGGIFNASTGQLTLVNTNIVSNTANASFGGGLYNEGQAILTSLNVKNNIAIANGGGLYSAGSSSNLILNNSTVIGNQSNSNGGGLYNDGPASLSSVSLIDNRTLFVSGGGIFNGSNGQLTVRQSTLVGNLAPGGNGGGIFNSPNARLLATGSTLFKNYSGQSGGGINNRGTLTLTQSALYSNTTTLQGGSGLYNNASARLSNVTFSYNTVLSSTTGAILNDSGALEVVNGTISHNAWPALARTGGSIVLTNTIVAASIGGVNCNSPLTSNGYNLDSGSSCGLHATGDISNTDPLLGPLVNNGGATLTRILQTGSPAIDAGNDSICPGVDQRGVTRPQGDHCDIGAYEVIGFTNSTPAPIEAGQCITSSTDVPSSLVIGNLQIGANVTFQPRGDLRIKLYSPVQRVSQLLDATGGSGQNLDVLWDDPAPDPVGTEDHDPAFPYYDLIRHPDHPLSVMSGVNLRGLWRLEICNVGVNTGTLNRWTLVAPNFGNPKVLLPLVRR